MLSSNDLKTIAAVIQDHVTGTRGHYEGGDEALLALRDRVIAAAIRADGQNHKQIAEQLLQKLYERMWFRQGLPDEGWAIQQIVEALKQAQHEEGTHTLLLVGPKGDVLRTWTGIENWDLVEDGNEFLGVLHRQGLGEI